MAAHIQSRQTLSHQLRSACGDPRCLFHQGLGGSIGPRDRASGASPGALCKRAVDRGGLRSECISRRANAKPFESRGLVHRDVVSATSVPTEHAARRGSLHVREDAAVGWLSTIASGSNSCRLPSFSGPSGGRRIPREPRDRADRPQLPAAPSLSSDRVRKRRTHPTSRRARFVRIRAKRIVRLQEGAEVVDAAARAASICPPASDRRPAGGRAAASRTVSGRAPGRGHLLQLRPLVADRLEQARTLAPAVVDWRAARLAAIYRRQHSEGD